MQRIPDHMVEQAKSADLLSLAERFTELRKAAAREWAGPCPKCGGADRFHVTADWFFCRQCHPKRGDAIEFVRWQAGADFRQAVEQLTGAALSLAPTAGPRAPERKPAPAQPADWRTKALGIVERANAALFDSPDAAPARAYLEGRGIDARAWLRYRLGYGPAVPLPGTEGKERAPAIVIPWFAGAYTNVRAIRYRFLQAHSYADAEGRPRTEKQTALRGSEFTGIWGGPADRGGESGRVVLICEGELNAASIWLAAHHTGLDVYSLGSESAKIPPAVVEYATAFKRAFVWADKNKIAHDLQSAIPGAYPIRSPAGNDANDLLQVGLLGGFLATVRVEAARDNGELEGLLWDLWDAASRLEGVDRATAAVMHKLSDRLGQPRRLVGAG